MKRLSFLALLSAQVCFAGTPLSNKDSEPAKKATTVVVTSKTSADAASAVQDKRVNPFKVLPQELMHEIFYQIMGTPMIPAYVGPDGKRRPVYSLAQRAEVLPFASTSRHAYRCLQGFSARWAERLSLERFEELDEQNTLSTNPLHCYNVVLPIWKVRGEYFFANLKKTHAPVITLVSYDVERAERFQTWKKILKESPQIRKKSLRISLGHDKIRDFVSEQHKDLRTFFDSIEVLAHLVRTADVPKFQKVAQQLTQAERGMMIGIENRLSLRPHIDLARFPFVKELHGRFFLEPLLHHPSLEEISDSFPPPVATEIAHCQKLRTLFLSSEESCPKALRILHCKNLQTVNLNLIETDTEFQIEGCPHAQVTVKRRVNFFLKEDGAERLARYAAQERQRVQLTIKNAIEGDAFVSLLQDAPTHVQKYFSHITAAGQTTDQPAIYLDLNQLPYVRYLSGGALVNLINHPNLEELKTTINRVSHCPALRKCALFPSKNATSPLLVKGCDLLKELRLRQDTRGVEVRDCAALEKIDVQTIDPYKQVRSLKFARLPSLKELAFEASTVLVQFESCHNLRRLRIETEGCVFLDGCSKLEALEYAPECEQCPRDIIALDAPLCEPCAMFLGESFLKRFITNDIDQKLPGYLERAIQQGVAQENDVGMMIYVLSSRGTKAMRVALNSLPPQAQIWDVDEAVQGVLDGKGNLVHKELRG